MVATDYWQPYEAFVPKTQHVQSKAQFKAEAFTVEGYNSLFRSGMACLMASAVSIPSAPVCAAHQNATANAKPCSNTPSASLWLTGITKICQSLY
jgi:hypothetical protein